MEVVRELGLITCERGAFRPGSQTPQLAIVPVANCPDVDHMEEEVQVNVQVEEGETHGKEQGEEQSVKERTTAQRG